MYAKKLWCGMIVVLLGISMAQAAPTSGSKSSSGGKTVYRILHRATIQRWMAKPMAHITSMRMVPRYVNRKLSGIKLVWVRKGSLYASVGLQPGDVVLSVNGQAMNAQMLLGLYAQLVGVKKPTLVLLRKRVLWRYVYRVVSGKPSLRKKPPMSRKPPARSKHHVPQKARVQRGPRAIPPGHRGNMPSVRSLLQQPAPRRDLNGRPLPVTKKPSSNGRLYGRFLRLRDFQPKLMMSRIRRNADGTYVLPRDVLAWLSKRLDWLAKQGAIVPYFSKGKPVGFRLFHLKRSGLYPRLGFQNGDILQSINGDTLTSPAKALLVFRKMKKAKFLSVVILRKGKTEKIKILLTKPKMAKPKPRSIPAPRSVPSKRR